MQQCPVSFVETLGSCCQERSRNHCYTSYVQRDLVLVAVVTGGLYSKLILWDYSKARPFHTIDFGALEENQQSGAQCCNPNFCSCFLVHFCLETYQTMLSFQH